MTPSGGSRRWCPHGKTPGVEGTVTRCIGIVVAQCRGEVGGKGGSPGSNIKRESRSTVGCAGVLERSRPAGLAMWHDDWSGVERSP